MEKRTELNGYNYKYITVPPQTADGDIKQLVQVSTEENVLAWPTNGDWFGPAEDCPFYNNTVIAVDMINGPIGSYGFRTGKWTATCSDGKKFRFYCSLPHGDGLNEKRMIKNAQSALDSDNIKGWIN